MPFNIGGLIISSTYSVPGDGKSSSTPARSGLELDLVYPRSKYHWRAMSNFVGTVLGQTGSNYQRYFKTAYAISSTTAADYTAQIMRNPNFYASGTTAWTVPDGGRWWLRDTVFSEPNGDYTPNSFLWINAWTYSFPEPYVLADVGFNDYPVGNAVESGNYYLVSTNLKP